MSELSDITEFSNAERLSLAHQAYLDGGATSVILFPRTYFLETWNVRRQVTWILLNRDRGSKHTVGSYGTRNLIEVIESWFWELSTDCTVLCLLSKFYFSGSPFLGAVA